MFVKKLFSFGKKIEPIVNTKSHLGEMSIIVISLTVKIGVIFVFIKKQYNAQDIKYFSDSSSKSATHCC